MNYDLPGLTETWLHRDERVRLREASPPSHVSTHIAADSGQQVAWELLTVPIYYLIPSLNLILVSLRV